MTVVSLALTLSLIELIFACTSLEVTENNVVMVPVAGSSDSAANNAAASEAVSSPRAVQAEEEKASAT